MHPSVCFVGAGPTTIYTLHALVSRASATFALTIFEEQAVAGRGTPYRPGWNDPAMLSNIASIELPRLEETLVEWLERQPADHLRTFGIDRRDIDDRAFYPRLLLGEFFRDQFEAILDRARSQGIAVDIRTRCRVIDASVEGEGIVLSVQSRRGAIRERFDHVVIATGHQWPAEPEVRPGYFLSPWPAAALSRIPPCRIGIRGTSLTAIDAAVAVAVEHGAFEEDAIDGVVVYRPGDDTAEFALTMMSRKGLLPEADFFHPIPYEPLSICTEEAIERLIEKGDGNLLEDAFSLFKRELAEADPAYAARTGLEQLELEEFCDCFFAERIAADPFEWARSNLEEAKRNFETQTTVAWRYAILRMHEVIEKIVPHLGDEEFSAFSRWWKPVFVDDYATVPHESIERMLALHRCDKLALLELGDDYRIDNHREEGGVVLHAGGREIAFPVFIEAMGQRPLEAKDFPFPSLRKQGVIRDEPSADETPSRGIVIDDEFHPVSDDVVPDRLFCLSLPFLLGRHPFSQGITSSHQMGEVVGGRLADALSR